MDKQDQPTTKDDKASYFGSNKQSQTLIKMSLQVARKVITKERTYRGSWMKRGGIGAFMMLARKWDRIEQFAKDHNYDIVEAYQATQHQPDGLHDDIDDLMGYLLLVKALMEDYREVDNYHARPQRKEDEEEQTTPPPSLPTKPEGLPLFRGFD